MTDALKSGVFAALDDAVSSRMPEPGVKLGVAVSGGGDSMALMILMDEWARARGAELEIASVDHHLRPESGKEALMVAEAAAELGRRHMRLSWDDWDGRGNMQAEARAARRRLLSDWAARRGLKAVALGHTMDDQAETVLMRLGRGAGVDGLSGMAHAVEAGGMLWLRPMLNVRRNDLRALLSERGVAWVDDPSNEDLKYDRVRARNALATLEDLGVTVEGLARTAGHMAEAREALDETAAALAAEAATWGACGELRLALTPLRGAPAEVTRRLFRAGLTRVSGADYGPRADAEGAALTAMLGLRLGGGRSLHGCVIRPDGPDGALITREASAVTAETKTDGLWDGRFVIETDEGGDSSLAPLGMAGDRQIKALVAAGALQTPESWRAAPKAARITTPALWRGEDLAAAPLAGYGTGLSARFAAPGPVWGMGLTD